MTRRFVLPILMALGLSAPAMAAEGLWPLDNLPHAQLEAQYAFEPDATWSERAMHGALRMANGCSASMVSAQGLVLTNAHCALSCAQSVSSADADRVAMGFLAEQRSDELRCPAQALNQLEQISDVSPRIEKATEGKRGQAFIDAKNAEKARIESECVGTHTTKRRCDVVELYGGSVYQLYRYHRYDDVRLVLMPEYRSGFFGGDADSAHFPRYSFDMALLRAYENGKPAASPSFFTFKRAGAEPGELTMVLSHPTTTQRRLTVAQLERLRDVDLLQRLTTLSERRALLWQYARGGDVAQRQVQTELTHTENNLKRVRGEFETLLRPALLDSKRADEAALRAFAEAQPQQRGDPWADIAEAQTTYRALAAAYTLLEQSDGFDSRYFQIARQLVRAGQERTLPSPHRLREYQDAALPRLKQTLLSSAPIEPDLEITRLAWSLTKLREVLGPDHPLTKLVLAGQAPLVLAQRLVKGTRLGDVTLRRTLWDGGFEAVAMSKDPFIELARAIDEVSRQLRSRYETEVEAVEARNATQLAKLRFAQLGDTIYPEATSTLRLSFGEVRGWREQDRRIAPYTDIAGLFARANGVDPFALAPAWQHAEQALAMDTRLNFVTTNDSIGGHAGGPVVNRDLQIVGLVFGGNRHALGGTFGYDGEQNRSVALHSAAMLEALDRVYHATALLDEMVIE